MLFVEPPWYGEFSSRTLVGPNNTCQTTWVDRGRLLKNIVSRPLAERPSTKWDQVSEI